MRLIIICILGASSVLLFYQEDANALGSRRPKTYDSPQTSSTNQNSVPNNNVRANEAGPTNSSQSGIGASSVPQMDTPIDTIKSVGELAAIQSTTETIIDYDQIESGEAETPEQDKVKNMEHGSLTQGGAGGDGAVNLENSGNTADGSDNTNSWTPDGNTLSPEVYYGNTPVDNKEKPTSEDNTKPIHIASLDTPNSNKLGTASELEQSSSQTSFIEDLRQVMKNFPKKGYRIDKNGNVVLPNGDVISGKEFMDRINSQHSSESSYSTSLFGRNSKQSRAPAAQQPQRDLIGPASANIFGMVETRVKKDRHNWGL